MKVANIVSTSNINVSDDFNVIKSINDIIDGLPTLIVGYDYVVKNYPDFDVTDICLGKNLYWTVKRTEGRDKFEEDLVWFKTKVYQDLMGSINYVFIDPIQQQPKTLVKIIKKIFSIKNKVSYVHDDMIYIYGDNLIFGLDLKLLNYMKINGIKIKNRIKAISTVFLEDNNIFIEYKKNVGRLGNQVRYIPYFYSIIHGENNTTSLIHIPRKG